MSDSTHIYILKSIFPKTSCNLSLTMIRRWPRAPTVETKSVEINYGDIQIQVME